MVSMAKPLDRAAEVDACLVLYPENIAVSIPALFKTDLIQRDRVCADALR